jgi:hypothetical protein
MNTRHISRLGLVLALALAGNAGAATLTLKPASGMTVDAGVIQTGQGGTVNLDLQLVLASGDALPGHYGGEIVVSYDSRYLDFSGFAPNGTSYFCDPLPISGCAPIVSTTGFNETVRFGFENAYNTNVAGTLSFTALGTAGTVASLGLADADDFFGTFLLYDQGLTPYEGLQFSGASVAVVPLPASVWLLGTAFGGLAAMRRRLRRTAG